MPPLHDKVALVTGAASGIGAAVVRRMAADGATVVLADLADGPGEALAGELGGTYVHTDVTDPAAWAGLVAKVLDTHGRLDVAHLNAGVHSGISDITKVDDDTYRRLVGVNVDGVFFGMRAALEPMRAQGSGAIVATASLAGIVAYPIDPVYDLTKHAVVGLVRSVAPIAGPGITVSCVCPGIVNTPMLGPEGLEMLTAAGFPVIQADEVAAAVIEAATSGRTGEAIVVQPGLTEPFRFPQVPGPRVEGARGKTPPIKPS